MSVVEPVVRPQPVADVPVTVDNRTLQILERRRSAAMPMRRGWLVRRALVVADLLGLAFAFFVATLVFEQPARSDAVASHLEFLIFLGSLPLWVVVAKLYGLYDHDEERTDHSTADDLVPVFHLVTVGSWLFYGFTAVTHKADPGLARLFGFWLFAIAIVTAGRAAARTLSRRNLAYLGGPEQLPQLVQILDVERVIVAFSNDSHEDMLDLIRSLKDLDIQIDLVPRFFEVIGTNIGIHTAEGLPLIGLPALRLSHSSVLLKRAMDLALSTLGLVLLAPVFAFVAIWIKLDSKGPVFFRQLRMGCGDQTFEIFKFRTMTVDAEERKHEYAVLNKHNGDEGDARMFKIPNDPRVTRLGAWLRRLSIDELPQLINVVRGEMSLVGPRPLILEEDQHVVDWRRNRLTLKPGITGLWQVLGRDDIPFEEMVRLDYVYVTTWSLLNDLKLILRTLPAMCRARVSY